MDKPGVVSFELLLDEATERAVRDEWEALRRAGLSSLAAHTAESNRPHITLLVRPSVGEVDAASWRELLPLPVTLGAPLLFGLGERRVLARSVVPTAELLELHLRVHAAAGAGEDLPHTASGAWTPHVTLARRIKTTDAATALSLVGAELSGSATALRRWDSASATVTPL